MKLTLFFVAIGCLNEGVSSAAGESRPPRVEWQKSLGGASFEIPIQVIQTSDGGFVFAATSASGIGGSKTSPSFDTNTMVNPDLYRAPIGDYWLVKLDAAGSQLWDRSFGFGNRDDCWNLLELPDGGFVLGGESITDERLDPVLGVVAERDVFLLRADSHGNPLWNHRFGESGLDTWLGAALMPDASLLVPGFGLLARLDALGNRADWPVSLDRAPYYFAAVHRLSDGGFALIGSWPNPSLVTNGDLLIGGLTDISVGRFAADGRKLWEQTYGGRLSEFGLSGRGDSRWRSPSRGYVGFAPRRKKTQSVV